MAETSNDPFSYHDLPNPAINIRLLRIMPGHNDDPIECSLSTFSTQDPPGYAAISYVWGDPLPTRAISIDGGHVEVGLNCYYALWQVRQAPRATYYWIDALCINQLHLQEKSHQVDMMGEIFSKAEQVLVSLGPHSDCSAFLTSSLEDAPRTDDVDDAWRSWFSAFRARGVDFNDRLHECVVWLGNRPYWARIWIIQEIVFGHNVLLLFDSDSVHWNTIRGLVEAFPEQRNIQQAIGMSRHYKLLSSPMAMLMSYIRRSTPYSLVQLVAKFEKNVCSNKLDHIYALLSLMVVPKDVSTVIRADYSKGTFDLAVDCLNHLDKSLEGSYGRAVGIAGQACHFFRVLGVDSEHPKLQAIVNKRRPAAPRYLADDIGKMQHLSDQELEYRRELPPIPRKPSPPYPFHRFPFSYPQRHILRLRLDEEGNFTGNFEHQYVDAKRRTISPSVEVGPASFLKLGASIVGLLCAPARAGDFVVMQSRLRPINPCFVIRQHGPDDNAIIGQALMLRDAHPCPGGSMCSCGGGCEAKKRMRFDFNFHEEDLIALIAQELAESDDEFYNNRFPLVLEAPVELLRRLQTDVTLYDWSSWAVFREDVE